LIAFIQWGINQRFLRHSASPLLKLEEYLPKIPSPPRKPTPPGPKSIVHLRIEPWGYITVDRQPFGISPPLKHLDLSPGKHTIVISNPGFPSTTRLIYAVDKK
jgi:hypothetical protein